MRAIVTCSVLEGDSPVRIRWLRDGAPLAPDGRDVKVESSNEFSSTLFIKEVGFNHRGEYTCVASNSAASANYSSNMVVNGTGGVDDKDPYVTARGGRRTKVVGLKRLHAKQRQRYCFLCCCLTREEIYCVAVNPTAFVQPCIATMPEENTFKCISECIAGGLNPTCQPKSSRPVRVQGDHQQLSHTCLGKRLAHGARSRTQRQRILPLPGQQRQTPGAPFNVRTSDVTSRSMVVTWDQPYTGNSHITAYRVQTEDFRHVRTLKCAQISGRYQERQRHTINLWHDYIAATKKGLPEWPAQGILRGLQKTRVRGHLRLQDCRHNRERERGDPPPPPSLSVFSTSSSSVQLQWNPNTNEEPTIMGYYVYIKVQHGTWEEHQVPAHQTTHTFEDLLCGTNYQFYVASYNKMGKSDPSEVMSAKTEGAPPVAPKRDAVLTLNGATLTVHLSSWTAAGCPIQSFTVQYRMQDVVEEEWVLVSDSIPAEQKVLVVPDLVPGKWYTLRVASHSEAGTTEHDYTFSTFTRTGASIPPLNSLEGRKPAFYKSVSIMVPLLCVLAVVVLIGAVLAFIIPRRRRQAAPSHFIDSCSEDKNLEAMSLSILKQTGSSLESASPNKEQLYYPSPYAMGQVQALGKQGGDCAEGEAATMQTLKRTRREHVYEVPYPRWVCFSCCHNASKNTAFLTKHFTSTSCINQGSIQF
ncbi:hypothetical protein HPB51_012879 [Rhipicephalus microplus]|uniref:Down syndrome cell adhesion molecule-like protein Dscam2 n=1 Tax=Rhipicephalus microplus TaxID=6941 RepID=A0A9J6DUJ5_RHIMP|nr:hypothetical protein HPB51_012879 [Rhipicephalus microplus]